MRKYSVYLQQGHKGWFSGRLQVEAETAKDAAKKYASSRVHLGVDPIARTVCTVRDESQSRDFIVLP